MKRSKQAIRVAKARPLARILSAPGWKTRPHEDGWKDGFAWISDVVTEAVPHLDVAQDKRGHFYLVDTLNRTAAGSHVCEVTAEEVWNYIARRWLPPSLRRGIAKGMADALRDCALAAAGH